MNTQTSIKQKLNRDKPKGMSLKEYARRPASRVLTNALLEHARSVLTDWASTRDPLMRMALRQQRGRVQPETIQ